MKKTFKSFLNEDIDLYQSDDKFWDEFLKQLKYIAFGQRNYQLETELGFYPKIVIVSKSMGFWFYIYLTRQNFLEDTPIFSSQFSITNVKEFMKSEIKHICDIKGRGITIEELLPKFIEVKMDAERTY